MNKYKMITICSLSIVCILILSLLLPLTTSANDKESMELNLHYEKSSVTVNISVNSQIYTGVVCKYIEVDNILEYDDLSYKTKENGKTLNLNKKENDNYTATIENVSKRYVVVYASIGNCSLCDYIDCQKQNSQSTGKTENTKQEENKNTNQAENTVTPSKNNTTTQPETPSQNENNTTTQPETPSQNENNTTTQPETPSQNENSTAKQPETSSQEKNNTKSKNKKSTTKQETKSKNNNTAKVVDKDSINTDDFEEIQSVDTTKNASTSDSNMPQTGENDIIKYIGIIIFSIIGMISFYKYKESSKSENI